MNYKEKLIDLIEKYNDIEGCQDYVINYESEGVFFSVDDHENSYEVKLNINEKKVIFFRNEEQIENITYDSYEDMFNNLNGMTWDSWLCDCVDLGFTFN